MAYGIAQTCAKEGTHPHRLEEKIGTSLQGFLVLKPALLGGSERACRLRGGQIRHELYSSL